MLGTVAVPSLAELGELETAETCALFDPVCLGFAVQEPGKQLSQKGIQS